MTIRAEIVVPVHKRDRPVLRAVDSVLRCAEAGVVVVAHGLCAEDLGLPNDSRVRIIEIEQGVGRPAFAFNAGVQAATAPLVGIMGSDDWFEDGAIATMLSRLQADRADGIISPLRHDRFHKNDLNPQTWRNRGLKASPDRLFFRTAPLGLFKTEIFKQPRYWFDEETVAGEDILVGIRLWTDGLSLSYYPNDPAYVVGSDAKTRVTQVRRPLSEHASAWNTMWQENRLEGLSQRELEDVAEKMFTVNILSVLRNRSSAEEWSASDFAWLSELVATMTRVAPGFPRSLTASLTAAYEAILAGNLPGTLSAITSGSYVDNRRPQHLVEVLHRNSWLRKQIHQGVARRPVDSTVNRVKAEIRRVSPDLPTPVKDLLIPSEHQWSKEDDTQVVRFATNTKRRLLIGGMNTAGQAKRWADAADKLDETEARSLGFVRGDAMTFPADATPSLAAAWHSPTWSKRQWAQTKGSATHVLVESGQPMLGTEFSRDPRKELIAMTQQGIRVGVVLHGSDIRRPSIHRELHADSPFASPLDGLTQTLEAGTERLSRFLDASNLPEFVSTPDLLDYRPGAVWLPTLHDARMWDEQRLRQVGSFDVNRDETSLPVVVHIPSRAALKGTKQIRPILQQLQEEGLIRYCELAVLTPEKVAEQVAQSDIVVDQVGMGLYGVASIEAMAIGKPVIAEVGDATRTRIQELTGLSVPIVEANKDTLEEVVRNLISNVEERKRIADRGRRYVAEVHSPERVAAILEREFLSVGA